VSREGELGRLFAPYVEGVKTPKDIILCGSEPAETSAEAQTSSAGKMFSDTSWNPKIDIVVPK
jgi:hypothetical protein